MCPCIDRVTPSKNIFFIAVLQIENDSFFLDTFNQSILADASQLKSSLASDDRFCTEINHFYPDF